MAACVKPTLSAAASSLEAPLVSPGSSGIADWVQQVFGSPKDWKVDASDIIRTQYIALLDKHGLEVRVSSIEHAGLGLWATRKIAKMTRLFSYGGEVLNYNQTKARYTDNPAAKRPEYVLLLGSDKYVDASDPFRGNVARFINRAPRSGAQNVRFADRTGSVITTKNISPGQELFVSYGTSFGSFRSGDKRGRSATDAARRRGKVTATSPAASQPGPRAKRAKH